MKNTHKMNKKLIILAISLFAVMALDAQNIIRPKVECPNGIYVNSYNGVLFYQRPDVSVTNRNLRLEAVFYYNSSSNKKNYGYGNGWSLGGEMRYIEDSLGIIIEQGDGRQDLFTRYGNSFEAPAGVFSTLSIEGNGYLLTYKDGTKYYFADVFEVNFNDDDSRKMIADYINSKTNNMFNVTPIPVDPNHGCRDGVCADDDTIDTSKFKLFDSTYLKATWSMLSGKKFDFVNHDGTISKNISFFEFYQEGATIRESEDYYLISSGFKSHNFNVLLPKEDCTDNAILTKSINKLLNFEATNSFRAHLTFTMPEFENYRAEPSTDALRKMGVQKLFDYDADYDNMFTKFSKEAHIDEIEHKAGISVDSRGIEASAITNSNTSAPISIADLPSIQIIANRPFLYSITNCDGLPLYVGQIYEL